jgi:hypothetical protein
LHNLKQRGEKAMKKEAKRKARLEQKRAKKLFPYEVETKNRSDFKGIYSHFKQAIRHGPKTPLLIIKGTKETQCPRGEIGRHKGLKRRGIHKLHCLRQSQLVSKHYQS